VNVTNTKIPSVDLLLAIDIEYRQRAAAGRLKKIAPKKFNPEGKAWLPVMHEERKGWRFTVLFSNTERAHALGKTQDWVVLYYDDGHGEQKCTVVTEHQGSSKGRRVIRGREKECADHYGVVEG
jgi:DNA polymerase (family 10)